MHNRIGPVSVSSASLDDMVEVLDGANIIVHGFDGVVTRWTSGCENLYGWTREEAVGRVIHELLATVFPEPLEAIRARVRDSGAWAGEVTHRHKEGRSLHIASRWIAPGTADADGGVIVQTNNDISGLKHAEQDLAAREAHLRSILETVPEAMVVID